MWGEHGVEFFFVASKDMLTMRQPSFVFVSQCDRESPVAKMVVEYTSVHGHRDVQVVGRMHFLHLR